MENTSLVLTRSEYIYVIRYGKIDNSDFAIEFFNRVKEECGIEIIIAYCRQYSDFVPESTAEEPILQKHLVLECYVRNDSNIKLSDMLTHSVENEIFCIFDELVTYHNISLDSYPLSVSVTDSAKYDLSKLSCDNSRFERHIFAHDFNYASRDIMLNSSCGVIEKFLDTEYNADAIVFTQYNDNDSLQHIIAFKSKKAMDSFNDTNGIQRLRQRFQKYVDNKDHWKVFSNITYDPIICLSSDLNEDQRYSLYLERK